MERFAVQTLRYDNSILQPLAVLLWLFTGVKALPYKEEEGYRSAVASVSKVRWFISMEEP